MFLHGIDDDVSNKVTLENEFLQLQFKNQQLDKEIDLKTKLNANAIADLNYDIMLKDLKIEEQNQELLQKGIK